jgi:hypothetical protein
VADGAASRARRRCIQMMTTTRTNDFAQRKSRSSSTASFQSKILPFTQTTPTNRSLFLSGILYSRAPHQ